MVKQLLPEQENHLSKTNAQGGEAEKMGFKTYESFAIQHPECSRVVRNLIGMEEAISSIGFAQFVEPITLMEVIGQTGSPKINGPLALHLDAFSRHIAYGTMARTRSLSRAIVHHLLENQLSIASVLQRK